MQTECRQFIFSQAAVISTEQLGDLTSTVVSPTNVTLPPCSVSKFFLIFSSNSVYLNGCDSDIILLCYISTLPITFLVYRQLIFFSASSALAL